MPSTSSPTRRYFCCVSSFSLRSLNYGAAIFHLIQAAIVLGVIQHIANKEKNAGETHSLRSGVYAVKKSIFVIQSSAPATLDEIWEKGDKNTKCSLPQVDIYNASEIMRNNMPTKGNTTIQGSIPPRNVMVSSFGTPDGMVINAHRNDIYRFDDMYVIPQTMTVGDLDTRYIIFSFFLLSGLFQLADGVVMGAYTNTDAAQQPRLLRFVEYSFSASIMILAIGVQTGVTEIYVLCSIFALIFTTNILGLIAEVFCCCAESLSASAPGQLKKIDSILPIPFVWLWTLPHFLGWITCIIGYAPLLDSYLTSTRCSDRGPPGFVNVIVFLEFVLFSSFGFVQFYSLYYRTEHVLNPEYTANAISSHFLYNRANVNYMAAYSSSETNEAAAPLGGSVTVQAPPSIAEQADYAYIMLSFIAKTLLAWLILSPVIMDAGK